MNVIEVEEIKEEVVSCNCDCKKCKKCKKKKLDFSKKLINDNRYLLWFINVGSLLLAFYCTYKGYVGALGWIAGMVSLSWAAHGTICSWYFSMAKSDHRSANGDGLTYATAAAHGFREEDDCPDITSSRNINDLGI